MLVNNQQRPKLILIVHQLRVTKTAKTQKSRHKEGAERDNLNHLSLCDRSYKILFF